MPRTRKPRTRLTAPQWTDIDAPIPPRDPNAPPPVINWSDGTAFDVTFGVYQPDEKGGR